MRKTLLSQCFASVLLLLCSAPASAEEKTTLVVWTKDSTKVAYALDEEPKISFTTTDLVITVQDAEVSFPLENMLRFTYADDTDTNILDLYTGEPTFFLNGDYLLFPSLGKGTVVSLHALDGSLISSKTISNGGDYTFPLSGLSSGVYMVNVNGVTYKIVR